MLLKKFYIPIGVGMPAVHISVSIVVRSARISATTNPISVMPVCACHARAYPSRRNNVIICGFYHQHHRSVLCRLFVIATVSLVEGVRASDVRLEYLFSASW